MSSSAHSPCCTSAEDLWGGQQYRMHVYMSTGSRQLLCWNELVYIKHKQSLEMLHSSAPVETSSQNAMKWYQLLVHSRTSSGQYEQCIRHFLQDKQMTSPVQVVRGNRQGKHCSFPPSSCSCSRVRASTPCADWGLSSSSPALP